MKIYGGESEMPIDVWSMVVKIEMPIDVWSMGVKTEKKKKKLIDENLWWWDNYNKCP